MKEKSAGQVKNEKVQKGLAKEAGPGHAVLNRHSRDFKLHSICSSRAPKGGFHVAVTSSIHSPLFLLIIEHSKKLHFPDSLVTRSGHETKLQLMGYKRKH